MACKKDTNDIFTVVIRVSSGLENLDNLEMSGNFDARRKKSGKCQEKFFCIEMFLSRNKIFS